MKKLTISLIGNPNSGKTTLFNQLTGSHQRVGNWAGVTVEHKEGQFYTSNHHVKLVDLPGTYSLAMISSQTSIDEQITCHHILSGNSDMIINVIDASNLERDLYLTLQLLETRIPCIVGLNMLDIANKQNIRINIDILSECLGCLVIPLVSTRGHGINALKLAIDYYKGNKHIELVRYSKSLLREVDILSQEIACNIPKKQRRWLGLQMLESNIYSPYPGSLLENDSTSKKLSTAIERLNNEKINDPALHIANARYQRISAICNTVNPFFAKPNQITIIMDKIILNRFLGVPIFFLMMYLMFFLSINIGSALQPIFSSFSVALFIHGIQWLGYTLHLSKWLTAFLTQGLGGGINTVLPLIPQISIMYLFLSFLEDSGYMARAAFVTDRLMQVLGLPGKSFVPLIVGFGCNVPSVMGARTLDTSRERLITIMMAPFISCGARLAIFAVFAATFFKQQEALIVFSLYILGIIMGILTGLMLKYTIVRSEASPFIMELPIYRLPSLKNLIIQTWQRLKGFVLRAGKIIIFVSISLSIMNSFSLTGKTTDNVNDSALAYISRIITPFFRPIGIQDNNWQAIVSLFTGVMAKEVVVGTLNTLYTAENIQKTEFNPSTFSISKELFSAIEETWQCLKHTFSLNVLANPIKASKEGAKMTDGAIKVMNARFGSPYAAYSYLIFVLLYIPCISVMGAILRESNRCWMSFSILWGLNLAYSLATLYYQTVNFNQNPRYSLICMLTVILFNCTVVYLLRWKSNNTINILF